jgi:hypothetical protein
MEVPACIVCFFEQNGVLPPSLIFHNYEDALNVIMIREAEVQCVMLSGDVITRGQTFINYEAYMNKMNTFQDNTARIIFYRVVGPYTAS